MLRYRISLYGRYKKMSLCDDVCDCQYPQIVYDTFCVVVYVHRGGGGGVVTTMCPVLPPAMAIKKFDGQNEGLIAVILDTRFVQQQ